MIKGQTEAIFSTFGMLQTLHHNALDNGSSYLRKQKYDVGLFCPNESTKNKGKKEC